MIPSFMQAAWRHQLAALIGLASEAPSFQRVYITPQQTRPLHRPESKAASHAADTVPHRPRHGWLAGWRCTRLSFADDSSPPGDAVQA